MPIGSFLVIASLSLPDKNHEGDQITGKAWQIHHTRQTL
jgi:hypothetical protein